MTDKAKETVKQQLQDLIVDACNKWDFLQSELKSLRSKEADIEDEMNKTQEHIDALRETYRTIDK